MPSVQTCFSPGVLSGEGSSAEQRASAELALAECDAQQINS
jgi:hypothetical protein